MPPMLTENLAVLFERDLHKMQTEINAYQEEHLLWQTLPGITNAGGNLCLHLLGNLQYYIGAVLGKHDYTRNRPLEFSSRDIPRAELNRQLDHVIQCIPEVIRSIPAEKLNSPYPEKVFDYEMSVEYFLLHLLAHLSYHLGQINYHRRMSGGS